MRTAYKIRSELGNYPRRCKSISLTACLQNLKYSTVSVEIAKERKQCGHRDLSREKLANGKLKAHCSLRVT